MPPFGYSKVNHYWPARQAAVSWCLPPLILQMCHRRTHHALVQAFVRPSTKTLADRGILISAYAVVSHASAAAAGFRRQWRTRVAVASYPVCFVELLWWSRALGFNTIPWSAPEDAHTVRLDLYPAWMDIISN